MSKHHRLAEGGSGNEPSRGIPPEQSRPGHPAKSENGRTMQRKQLSLRRLAMRLVYGTMLAGMLASTAPAEELAGVTLPATTHMGDQKLVLNGMGLRTYSLFAVHIYVAGLYLQSENHDAKAIIASPAPKLLLLYFVHDVPADKVRDAWRKGLTHNCVAPCKLPPAELKRFLAALPAMSSGETVALMFSDSGLKAYFDGSFGGAIKDPRFAKAALKMFLGPDPSAPGLKKALLGLPH